jgi:cytoskeletal protein CcmA (bactofilin family)
MLRWDVMQRIPMVLLIGLATVTLQIQGQAQTEEDQRNDLLTIDLGKDHFAAGQNIAVAKAVEGDLLAAGREVIIEDKVGGDAAAAGGTVRLNGNISDNTYAAGGQVFVNGTISRNARLAGGTVEISPSSRIDGGASIAAGEVRVNGAIGGYLQAAGGSVYINGPVGGDVEASGGSIELGPNARINGRLRSRSRAPLKQDEGAQVLGGIEQLPYRVQPAPALGGLFRVIFWVWMVGLMLLVAIILVLLPGFGNVIATVEARPGASALLGFVLLVCIPVASLILLITLIGAPLALLAMAAYLALLLVGYLAAAAAVGDTVLKRLRPGTVERIGWRIAAAICGIFAIAILGRIPILGSLIVFAALIMGIGAVGLQINRALRPAIQ